MLSASKITFSHYNLNILRHKVTKNLKNFRKKFFESPPCSLRDRNEQNFCSTVKLLLKRRSIISF